mmetsp:Transcript_90010/g.178951  ORF Transcript_90010/g.178951 Transcript_90010/m.178951 type:complete len:263 (-) Transcript_90010:160-948(-)
MVAQGRPFRVLLFASVAVWAVGPDAFLGEAPLRPRYARNVARLAANEDSVDTIARAKEWLAADGFYHPIRPELMAEDFVWEGPVVGPLNKHDFIGTVGMFKVYHAFPDLKQECFGWSVDPQNRLKAWCFHRVQGTHTVDLYAGARIPATSKELRQNVQAISVTLNSQGQVERYTGGYVVDNRPEEGNTGGLGGLFGVLRSIGVPSPTPGGKMTRFLNFMGSFKTNYPKAQSHKEDLPKKYTDRTEAAYAGRKVGLRTADSWK